MDSCHITKKPVKKLPGTREPLTKINEKKSKKRKISNSDEEASEKKKKCIEVINVEKNSPMENGGEEIITEKNVSKEKENVKVTPKHKTGNKRKRVNSTIKNNAKIDTMFKKMKDKASEPKTIDVVDLDDDASSHNDSGINDSSDHIDQKSKETSLTDKDTSVNDTAESCDPQNDSKQIESTSPTAKKTPKQSAKEQERLKRQEEREKARLAKLEEKEKLRLEKEKVRLAKEEEKEKQRLAKEEEKEKLRLAKEQEKLDLLKAKEEKLKMKQELTEAKQKEKDEKQRKKEEERQKREEERKRKEDEKLQTEIEQKEKASKMKAKFANFFVPKKTDEEMESDVTETHGAGPFMMFQVKDNMKLAPVVRCKLGYENKKSLDEILQGEPSPCMYLTSLKSKDYVIGRSSKTYFPSIEKQDDCEIIDEDEECIADTSCLLEVEPTKQKKLKGKLLLFCENRRPAYYGTWSKKSKVITARKPFGKEEELFDYDYDSDDDWEEEESGESLSDSEGEDAEEGGEDQYEVDNDVFVPHGYLSDDEGIEDDAPDDEIPQVKEEDGEEQKKKLKQKQEEFELEMKEKTKQLKPKVYGCVWMNNPDSHPAYTQLSKILHNYKCIPLWGSLPIGTTHGGVIPAVEKRDDVTEEQGSAKKFAKEFPDAAIPDLIRLVHENTNNQQFIVKEFTAHWEKLLNSPTSNIKEGVISRRKILEKIRDIAQYGKDTEAGAKKRWTVSKDIRLQYLNEDIPTDYKWTYNISPKKRPDGKLETEETPKSKATLITKFTKVLNDNDKAEYLKTPVKIQTPKTNETPQGHMTPMALLESNNKKPLTPIPRNNAQPKSKSSITKFFRKQKSEPITEEKPNSSITLE